MRSGWASSAARGRSALERLVYRSRLIGREPTLCVWGGGNTSTKTVVRDLRGRRQVVLYIKGSGSDLRTCEARHFSPIRLDDVRPLLARSAMSDEAMVAYLAQCLLRPDAPRPSIEALLHAFLPESDIDHTHADAIVALTNTAHGRAHVRRVFGDDLLWVPYVRPGFALSKQVAGVYQAHPRAKGVVLEQHGLITWGPDGAMSYARTIEMVTRAEAYLRDRARPARWRAVGASLAPRERERFLERHLPVLRGAVSTGRKHVLAVTTTPAVLRYVNGAPAARVSQVGPATPDHMLRIKRLPLVVRTGRSVRALAPTELARQVARYRDRQERYFLRHRRPGQTVLETAPRVILIPGVGMVTVGKDAQEARIVADVAERSLAVQRAATLVDRYTSVTEAEAFAVEYWPMELYKLSLAPAERELAREVGVITGAAGAIGSAIAAGLVEAGAHVVLTDRDTSAVERLARELVQRVGAPRAVGFPLDVTRPASVTAAFRRTIRTFGGLDFVVSNAGVASVGAVERLSLAAWNESLAVNATGHFLVAREAVRVLRAQGLGGSLVFIASKNVLAPGRDFAAYSAAKSAETQLARIVAIEHGEAGIRVNLVNPDGIFEGSGLWAKIGPDRARTHGVSPSRLAAFYQQRNLMQVAVAPRDVAEAVQFFVSRRSAKTTGCILTVDGGLREAFPR